MIRRRTEATLLGALTYELQQLYYSEIVSESKYHELLLRKCVEVGEDTIRHYLNGSTNKIHLLEQAFKYLMAEPHREGADVITDLTEEVVPLLSLHRNLFLHNISAIGYIQVINSYRVAGYRTAYAIAAQLKLDFVTDVIQQILEWELGTAQELSDTATEMMHLQSA